MMPVRSPVVVMTLLLGLVTSALAVSLRAAAQVTATGVIRGRVAVPDVPAAPPRPAVGDLSGATHPVVDRRRVVVYLESAPRNAFDELRPGLARMDQRGEQFVPRVLAITVGTSVL